MTFDELKKELESKTFYLYKTRHIHVYKLTVDRIENLYKTDHFGQEVFLATATSKTCDLVFKQGKPDYHKNALKEMILSDLACNGFYLKQDNAIIHQIKSNIHEMLTCLQFKDSRFELEMERMTELQTKMLEDLNNLESGNCL